MPPLSWFAILTSTILHLSQCTIYSETRKENKSGNLSPEWIKALLNSSAGFLAGEDTPVWVAEGFRSLESVDYKKLEDGIVGKAIHYWKSIGLDGFNSRKSRSVDEPSEIAENLKYSVAENFSVQTRNNSNNGDENRTKRSVLPEGSVLYPSVLIMMDYETSWPRTETEQQKLIYERILYALAFWNGVDLQFRHLQNPEVRIRIAGIIIARNKEATPYLREHEGWFGLDMTNAFKSMKTYWQKVSTYNNTFFPRHAYHFAATMTSAKVSIGLFSKVYAISHTGPPCHSSDTVPRYLISPDDLAFSGIQAAVHETAHVLGAERHDGDLNDCPMKYGHVLVPSVHNMGRTWSECSLQEMSHALKTKGFCMRQPHELYPPGIPVDPILPGELMSASVQCQGRGWQNAKVCWEKMTCDRLYCSNDFWYSSCQKTGVPADGSICGEGKICLDGHCVSEIDIFNATSRIK